VLSERTDNLKFEDNVPVRDEFEIVSGISEPVRAGTPYRLVLQPYRVVANSLTV
jgi:hypothetical protein